MRRFSPVSILLVLAAALGIAAATPRAITGGKPMDGRAIFRFDTFGDEQLWTDTLRMHEALAPVTPAIALSVGLKVDVDALPPPVLQALQNGTLDVNDPKITRRLLELNAVVGVVGKVSGDRIQRVGITCALCHSTVDDSLAPGIGHRLDGWPNSDLAVGDIVALSNQLPDALRAELREWPPGSYDPRHHIFDGHALQVLHSPSQPVPIPPAYGLAGVGFETATGDGPISYWNSYVGVTQMGGHGSFSDDRIEVNVSQKPDLVTPKLSALLDYQLGLPAPPPPPGSFDPEAAEDGRVVFQARCASCHVPPTYTDVALGPDPQTPLLHDATEVGADPTYAEKSATGQVTPQYRTAPLRALWQHPPYFHDGSAADLPAVVAHYEDVLEFTLSDEERANLIEFLKSL